MSRKPKLLFCCASPYRGGAEEYGLNVAKAAKRDGYRVDASFPPTDEMQSLVCDFRELGARYYPLDIVEPDTEWAERGDQSGYRVVYRKAMWMLLRARPDIVHIELGWPNRSFGIIQACARLNIPTVLVFQLVRDVHAFTEDTLRRYAWARSRRQTWVSVSENNRGLVCNSFKCDPEEIALVYNGAKLVELDESVRADSRREIREEFGFQDDTRILLTVGQLHMQKGYFELAPIIPALLEEHPDLRFLWVGEGLYREKLEEELTELGVADRVIMTGRRNDVPRLLYAADLFVFPTLFEGFPFSLVEAAAHKLPLVTTDASSIPEFIEDGVHGIMVKAHDREAFRDGVLRALQQPEAMQRMAEAARERMRDFSEDRMIDKTLALFRSARGVSKT